MFGETRLEVGLSIGVAYLEGAAANFDLVMTTADAALYEIKKHGRNGYFLIDLGRGGLERVAAG